MAESVVEPEELTKLVASFLERNRDSLMVQTGWAPNPPAGASASKLAKVIMGSETDFSSHQIFWLWKQNGEETWHLVDPSHQSVIAARKSNWVQLDFHSEQSAGFVRSLPIEVLKNC